MAHEPTLTAVPDGTLPPCVLIAFTTVTTGTATLNVYRSSSGRQMLVRGGLGLPVSGGAGLVDFEAPAAPCAYYAEMLDADGNSLGFTGSAAITPTLARTWIHNPFNPAGGVAVRVAAATGASVAGQIPITVAYPVGRAAGVAITGPRRGIATATVMVYAATLDDSNKLDAMFGPLTGDLGLPPFVCIRFASAYAARIRLAQPLFLAVPAPTQTPVNLLAGGTRIAWDLSGPEVDPPAAALVQAPLRREDVNAYYPTRAAFNAAYASRLAASTDFNLAGYAG